VGASTNAATTKAAANPIQRENALPGSPNWRLRRATPGAIDGYASQVSLVPGDELDLHVSTSPAARYRVEVYRVGWYAGAGARLVGCVPGCASDETGTPRPDPGPDGNGETVAGRPVTDELPVPADAVSGSYVANLLLP